MLQLGWVNQGRILELKLRWAIAHVCMVETGLATQQWCRHQNTLKAMGASI